MNRIVRIAAVAALAVGATAAAPAAAQTSGFLDDYARLAPDAEQPGARSYRKADADLGSYSRVMIEPIEVAFSATSKVASFSPDQLKAVTDELYATLVRTLEPEYAVVNVAGPGVLRVRLAVTGLDLQTKKKSLLNYTPIGFAATTVAEMAGGRIEMREAVLEAEISDSVSGDVLGMVVDDAPAGGSGQALSWQAIVDRLALYATRFRARLDAARR